MRDILKREYKVFANTLNHQYPTEQLTRDMLQQYDENICAAY